MTDLNQFTPEEREKLDQQMHKVAELEKEVDLNLMRQPLSGPLQKFTNVMTGWQTRFFQLDPSVGEVRYYVKESHIKQNKIRGGTRLLGAKINPSEEDSLTFSIIPLHGESLKCKASNTKERQEWINRLRVCAEDQRKLAQKNSAQFVATNTKNKSSLKDLPIRQIPTAVPANVLRIKKLLSKADEQQQAFIDLAERYMHQQFENHENKDIVEELLLTKAISASLFWTMQDLYDDFIHFGNGKPVHRDISGSPLIAERSILAEPPVIQSAKQPAFGGDTFSCGIEMATDANVLQPIAKISSNLHEMKAKKLLFNDPIIFEQCKEEAIDDKSKKTIAMMNEYKTDILSLVSTFSLGADLCKCQMPSFCLAPQSLLETIADALQNVDLLSQISTKETALDRIGAVTKWYLSLFGYATRFGTTKKPYNPLPTEQFRCVWRGADGHKLNVLAEQISHHPLKTRVNSKFDDILIDIELNPLCQFMGFNVQADLKAKGRLVIGKINEAYTFDLPNVYARSIVSTPWFELVGVTKIECQQSGLHVKVQFHAKPMYGGMENSVAGSVSKIDNNAELIQFDGQWADIVTFQYKDGSKRREDIDFSKVTGIKFLPPIDVQCSMESRKLWKKVTQALQNNDFDKANDERAKLQAIQEKIIAFNY